MSRYMEMTWARVRRFADSRFGRSQLQPYDVVNIRGNSCAEVVSGTSSLKRPLCWLQASCELRSGDARCCRHAKRQGMRASAEDVVTRVLQRKECLNWLSRLLDEVRMSSCRTGFHVPCNSQSTSREGAMI